MCDYQLRDVDSFTQSSLDTKRSGNTSGVNGISTSHSRAAFGEHPYFGMPTYPRVSLDSKTQPFCRFYESSPEDGLSAVLMDHYLVRTSVGFAPAADSDSNWNQQVAYASTLYPFLRHALLAISGLHACRTDSVNAGRYYHAACFHAVKASTLFRSTVADLNVENWVLVAEFIITSVFFNFDVSFVSQRFGDPSSSASPASIVRILRGPKSLGSQIDPLVFSHPRANNLLKRILQHRFPPDEELMTAIGRLEGACHAEATTSGSSVLQSTAQSLRQWAQFVSCQPKMWVHFFSWSAGVFEEYIEMLESGCGLANVIIVYWCAIMLRAPKLYYLIGTMDTLARLAIKDFDGEFSKLLNWPLRELRTNGSISFE
ncbi:unnamed protein product [Clonostachys chloroleuca]|uniref:Uncharacterized protein n=1 Tax=Clonostachys chloroleuca TaxID=1926264 RepID=A0AA35LRY8_9HYPO|nr:unnamed protein product [Clonostachys chloroleuca]